jgi:hypothetical protein
MKGGDVRVRVRTDFEARIRDGRLHAGITATEDYFVIGIGEQDFRIVDDAGEPILYPKELFDVVDSSLPPGWQFAEYPDGEYWVEPTKTAAPGFYEDFFGSDGERAAQAQAHQAVREVLEAALAAGGERDQRLLRRDLNRLVGSR